MVVVGKEFILTIGQVDGVQLEVGGLELLHEPFQRHGVPDDDTVILCTDLLDGFLHVVIAHHIISPTVLLDKVMTEAALVHDDGMPAHVGLLTDLEVLARRGHHTMGEELYDGLSVRGIVPCEAGIHSEHQVRLFLLQVFLSLQGGLQLDDIRDVQLLEDHLQEVDVITIRFTVLIQEHIGPQVPCIFIDEGPGLVIYDSRVFICRSSNGL